ncbi:MAG: hypothetical protein NTZ19_10420 [Bacteroidetes bacterium]|nr:hypothetical protein [Bacteroidota bacterium]
MKTIIICLLLCSYMNSGFSQNSAYGKERVRLGLDTNNKAYQEAEAEWTKLYAYSVMIGTSKLSASGAEYGTGIDGFRIKEKEIKIVGFLHRYSKIEYDHIYVETKLDTMLLDSQVMKGRSINASWKDFYIKLKDVAYSNNYKITVYSYPEKVLLASKVFYIKKQ